MKVLAVCNQKGGVGKTTTASALMSGLTEKGYRVLGIDLDPQTNLTISTGAEVKGTAFGVLTGEVDAADAITETPTGDLLPSSDQLANADLILKKRGDEYRLKNAIDTIRGEYDFMIIDCPPSLGILTMNAIKAADYVIIPAQADGYSLFGINELSQTIEDVNPDVKVAGILLTMFNGRTRIAREVSELLDQLAAKLDTKVFDTKIRSSVKASEIQFHPVGLFKYAPRATVTQDYAAWIDELLQSL